MIEQQHFCKAAPVGKKETESAILVFDLETPDYAKLTDFAFARVQYETEGRKLEKALYNVLSGGAYDQLLRAMLERRASLFRVPFGGKE